MLRTRARQLTMQEVRQTIVETLSNIASHHWWQELLAGIEDLGFDLLVIFAQLIFSAGARANRGTARTVQSLQGFIPSPPLLHPVGSSIKGASSFRDGDHLKCGCNMFRAT